ncbi:hypothetical protein [Paraburkholderia phosphatilytica]|uniref:hypothetical protein n=1 Tax=Paraburkholderia phosphatilytica TaxID=2282883 RepID=UPI001F0C8142|nr:hypothetical protein [Paraburkholderia phosphatilytica]
MEKCPYVLSGSMCVQDDIEPEDIESVSRHLNGIAEVYLSHDKVSNTIALRIAGTIFRDDVRVIEKRIERFAEEHGTTGTILRSDWNGTADWLMVGLNWQVQCLMRLGAVQEQLGRLMQPDTDFLVKLEPPEADITSRSRTLVSVALDTPGYP